MSDAPTTTLRAMAPAGFAAWLATSVAEYAADNVACGRWPAEGALARSQADFDSLLPLGLATPDHHLFDVLAGDGGPVVGQVWFALERGDGACGAFVYDLGIAPAHRRAGHARRALAQVEALAAALGATALGLHVFAFNDAAQALYRRLGFRTTGLNMKKPIDAAAAADGPARLRAERPGDAAAIAALHAAAFAGHPHSRQTEAAIVAALRAAGVLTVSLVAEAGGGVVGHVACSPVTVDGREGGWYGLGPVAVAPAQQRRGIGQALVRRALAVLDLLGAQGCVLLGDPAYYGRFGFVPEPALVLPGVPASQFMARPIAAPPPAGVVAYHPAFDAR